MPIECSVLQQNTKTWDLPSIALDRLQLFTLYIALSSQRLSFIAKIRKNPTVPLSELAFVRSLVPIISCPVNSTIAKRVARDLSFFHHTKLATLLKSYNILYFLRILNKTAQWTILPLDLFLRWRWPVTPMRLQFLVSNLGENCWSKNQLV